MEQPKKKINGTIIIPTLNIENDIEPIYKKILSLKKATEELKVNQSFKTIKKLKKIERAKDDIKENYEKIIQICYTKTGKPVSGPGITMAFYQTWSLSKGMLAITKMNDMWNDLVSLIDRKNAYAYALLSIKIAIWSLFITIILGIVSVIL